MNAALRKSFVDTLTGIEPSKGELRRRLLNAIDLYNNCDSFMRDGAIDAIVAGRAVFWTATTHSNARAYDLPIALNRGVGMAEALEATYHGYHEQFRAASLDTLVPLNRAAVEALSDAYAREGTWRDFEELEARRIRDMRRAA